MELFSILKAQVHTSQAYDLLLQVHRYCSVGGAMMAFVPLLLDQGKLIHLEIETFFFEGLRPLRLLADPSTRLDPPLRTRPAPRSRVPEDP